MERNVQERGGASNGQAEIWRYMFGFADSMALKCAVELRIPDIVHSHSQPITLSQIVSYIDHPPDSEPNVGCLARIMRLLVRRKIFTASGGDDGDTIYGPTSFSKWLLHDSELSLAPMLLMQNHPSLLAPWHCFSRRVREGGVAFEKAHGRLLWELVSDDSELSKIFKDAMECTSKIVLKTVMEEYGDRGFGSVGSVVDVGGGTGSAVAEIVRAYPHVKGINFDLAHVVANAPPYVGVSHVGGDVFEAIPAADVALVKFVMHNWSDEKCVKILKNCRRAIPEISGKVVIVEVVVKTDGDGEYEEMGLIFDVLMIAHTSTGKARTEAQWKNLLNEAGFPRYNIIDLPTLTSIIEAYPI